MAGSPKNGTVNLPVCVCVYQTRFFLQQPSSSWRLVSWKCWTWYLYRHHSALVLKKHMDFLFFCGNFRVILKVSLQRFPGIQSYSQLMIGVSNHLLSIVFRFHYHSQKVIGSLGIKEVKHQPTHRLGSVLKPQHGAVTVRRSTNQQKQKNNNNPQDPWTLQWKGERTCMTQVCFGPQNSQLVGSNDC